MAPEVHLGRDRFYRPLQFKISAIYAFVGIAYIFVSDWLIHPEIQGPWAPDIQTYKGLGFVFITALALFFYLRHEFAKRQNTERVEKFLRYAVENLSEGVCLYDADDRLVLCNARYFELFPHMRDVAVSGRSISEIVHANAWSGQIGEAIGREKEFISERLANFNDPEGPLERTLADGQSLLISVEKFNGGSAIIITDITEQTRRMQEMQLLIKASHAIVDAPDTDSALIAALQVICETWHWPYAEVWWPTPNGDDLAIRTAWTDGDPLRLEFLELSKKITYAIGEGHPGRTFRNNKPEWLPDIQPAEYTGPAKRRHHKRRAGLRGALGVPIENGDGEPIGVIDFHTPRGSQSSDHIVSIVTTIARQLGQYIGRKLSEDALRETETLFRQIAENLHEVFWVSDPETTRMEYVSPAYEAVWGRPVAEVYNNPQSFIDAIHPDEREWVAGRIARQAEGDYEAEYRIRRPDGEIRWIMDKGTPIRNDEGKVYRVVGVAEDITGLKQRETELAHAQKLEVVGQLTGGVAHDFNNLLTVVMGNLQLLERRVADDERQAAQVRMALDATRRGAELTQRLLAFSRRQVLEPEVAGLNELVEGLVPLLKRTLGEAIELRTELAEELPPVRIDIAQFESALINLAVNARDAMPDGGLLLIETRKTQIDKYYAAHEPELTPGNYIAVSVSDTGSGIEPELIERIFEPFFTTKEAGQGSGLGLSMVYGFVKQSRGHVSVYSELENGTTIRLYFPITADNADTESTQDAGTDGEPITAARNETVLVVEDEEAVRITLETVLEDYGYRVVSAGNGPEAVDLLREHDDIDLLLTDVVMPGGMNGRELAEQARQMKPDLKVLVTSGYPRETISQKGVLADDIEFISKPYEHTELIRRIRELLGGSA